METINNDKTNSKQLDCHISSADKEKAFIYYKTVLEFIDRFG
jgi:hypothetical protein